MKLSFTYDKWHKPAGSMLVGTPPELDIALYTLCVALDIETCKISLDGKKFTIRAYSFKRGSDIKMIASGYPDF